MHILKFSPPGEIFPGWAKNTSAPGGLYRDKFRQGAHMFFAGGDVSGGDFILRHRPCLVLPRGDATVYRLSVCPSVTFRYPDHIGWNTSKITAPPNSDKIVMWRFLRNHRLILRIHTIIFRALIYCAHRAVIFAIAWLLVEQPASILSSLRLPGNPSDGKTCARYLSADSCQSFTGYNKCSAPANIGIARHAIYLLIRGTPDFIPPTI